MKILNHHRNVISKNRHDWSFRVFLLTGDQEQKNTSYKGTITRYEESLKQNNKI